MECYKTLNIIGQMIWLHFGIKQMEIDKTMDALHPFAWNYVKYANMEGFCRDSHIY